MDFFLIFFMDLDFGMLFLNFSGWQKVSANLSARAGDYRTVPDFQGRY
jgi:hypothetical protein